MKEGHNTVKISNVRVLEDSADIEFTNEHKETLQQKFFYQNFGGYDINYLYKQLVASTAKDPTELWSLFDNLENIKKLEGRSLVILVGNNGGVPFKRVPEGFTANGILAPTLTELHKKLLEEQQLKLYRTEIKEIHSDPAAENSTNTEEGNRSDSANNDGRRKIPTFLEF